MFETSSAAPVTLDSLFAELEQLAVAIEQEDHSQAERLMHNHQGRLRQYCADLGAEPPTARLGELWARQQSLLTDMIQRRDHAGQQLRSTRQSTLVAKAYQQAESLE